MTAPNECPNYEINDQMCPCTEDCPRHAICCECIGYHMNSTQWPLSACMRGAERASATLELPKQHDQRCVNYEKNLDACPCESEDCQRRGVCCDCVRNHWGNAQYPMTACMKSA